MTTRELLQKALGALEVHTFMTRPVHESTEAMAAISEYLAKPEPETVGWYCCYPGQFPFLITEIQDLQDHIGYTEPIYRKDQL